MEPFFSIVLSASCVSTLHGSEYPNVAGINEDFL